MKPGRGRDGIETPGADLSLGVNPGRLQSPGTQEEIPVIQV